jgi:Fur family peroxide stress response transcriptional regulator
MVNKDEIRNRMDHFTDACKQAGVKLTHQRTEVFREVASSRNHPDAETIYTGVRARIPSISLDTVYRTLWLLNGLGLITTLGPYRDRVRFDANNNPHHHFICVQCGMAEDFDNGSFDILEIPEEVKKMGTVDTVQVSFRGLCLHCSKKEKRKNSLHI